MQTNAATAEANPPSNVINLTPPPRRLGRMPAATSNGVRRQRFRILDFENSSGTRSYRVQGMNRDKVYVRENFADLRAAECRRTQLENEYILGDDAPLRAPRMTMLTEDQLQLAEQIFRTMHKAEVPDCDLSTAVSAWLKAGRQKDAGIAPRLDEAFEQYLAWLSTTPTLRPRTKENYRLDAITPEMIEAYLAKRDVGSVARDSDRRVVKAFFAWAIRPQRWLTINAAAGVTVELGQQPEPHLLTVPQCETLLQVAEAHRDGKFIPFLAVCLFAGLRPSEASRLTWEKVNFRDKEIRLGSTDTKTGRARIIPLEPTLAAWLKAYQGRPFPKRIKWEDMLAIREAAGITTWQSDFLRHTSISHYFRRCGSYGKTAEFHGNSESIIKQHYQGRVTSAETKRFYEIMPTKGDRK